MPVERATLDNDSAVDASVLGAVVASELGAVIVTVNWVDSFVDCCIVDLWLSDLVVGRMNGLHYSHLCCNSDSNRKIAHCSSYCCLSRPSFGYRTRCCKFCM